MGSGDNWGLDVVTQGRWHIGACMCWNCSGSVFRVGEGGMKALGKSSIERIEVGGEQQPGQGTQRLRRNVQGGGKEC